MSSQRSSEELRLELDRRFEAQPRPRIGGATDCQRRAALGAERDEAN